VRVRRRPCRSLRPGAYRACGRGTTLSCRALPRSGPGTRRNGDDSRDRTKNDFDPHLIQVFIPQVEDLFEPLLANRRLSLLENLVLAFNHSTPHCPLSRLVPFEAFLKGDIEEQGDGRHLILPCKVQQVPASLRGKRGGIHDAEAVQAEPLLDQEMEEREGLSLIPLVPLVVANASPRPVGRDDLSGTEVALREGGLPAGRRSAEDDDRRSHQAEGLLGAWE
jgi:hypothetical protein